MIPYKLHIKVVKTELDIIGMGDNCFFLQNLCVTLYKREPQHTQNTASYRRVVSETEHNSLMNTKWRTISGILIVFLLSSAIVLIRWGRKITTSMEPMLRLVPIGVNRSFTRAPTSLVFSMNSSGKKFGHSRKNRAQWESSGCRSSISILDRNLLDTTLAALFTFPENWSGLKFALSITGHRVSLTGSWQYSTYYDWNALLQHLSSVT